MEIRDESAENKLKEKDEFILELVDENIRLMDENIRLTLENARLKSMIGQPRWARSLFVENHLKSKEGDYVIVVGRKCLRDN